jgi:putative transposase
MIDIGDHLSIRKQSELLKINRSSFYYKPIISDDSLIANLIQEAYAESDYRYGYRKISAVLNDGGTIINAKKILRLMQEMNIEGLYPKRFVNTTQRNLEHMVYPYLLQDVDIIRANQVWATDITYIRIADRFMYFIAIIDLYSRYIIAHDLSHDLGAEFCIATLEDALKKGSPDIFNTDQGCQFTSIGFTEILAGRGIRMSMDHKGRCFDNIYVERLWRTLKQEAIYYYKPGTIRELEQCLGNFVLWYNNERVHQALSYKTPAFVYGLKEGAHCRPSQPRLLTR